MFSKIKSKNKQEKGITLLALVVTIIIIIILSVVAINFLFGENGLVIKAQQGKKLHDIEDARERLGTVLADAFSEKKINPDYEPTEFLDEFIYDREPEAEADEYEISLDGHVFELDRNIPQLGEYIEEVGNLPPRIRKIDVTNKTYSEVSIEVTTARAEGLKYRYSYKKDGEEYGSAVESDTNTYTFSNLETKVKYTIKAELVKDGQVVAWQEMSTILGLLEEGSLTFGKVTWSGGKASVSVSTTTSNQIQYQIIPKDGQAGNWTTIANNGIIPNIPNGALVCARLWDGNNGSEEISREIVDEEPPIINNIKELETTETTIKVQIEASDTQSGIAKIEYSSDNGANYKTGTSTTATEYKFTGLQRATEYTIKVKVTDNAGNTVEDTKKIETVGIEKFSDIYETTTEYRDSEGNTAWIPGGFAVGTSKGINIVSRGLVITDKIDENNNSIGNEFVWIPVDDISLKEMYQTSTGTKLNGVTTTTTVYSKLRVRNSDSSTCPSTKPGQTVGAREPDVLSDYDTSTGYYKNILGYGSTQEMAEGIVKEYEATYTSIEKYDGFYVGRYELTGDMSNPTVKPKELVLSNQNWYNFKKACSNIVKNSYAQSTMIYGNQWDEIMDWFLDTGARNDYEVNTDSTAWGNYNSIAGQSRVSEIWKTNNIYDLAGNYFEWTQEACNDGLRVMRGRILEYLWHKWCSVPSIWAFRM